MNTKQKWLPVLLSLMSVTVGISSVVVSETASADPQTSKVTCANGKKKTANKSAKQDKTILDDKDFQEACKNDGGYKAADETIVCGDGTSQNVTKGLADPKDKLNNKDRKAACGSHVGIKDDAPSTEEPATTDGGDETGGGSTVLDDPVAGDDCGGVKTAIIKCTANNEGGVQNNGIWALLLIVINVMTAGVGVLAVAGIVYGAILYTTAEDKADQVKKATDIITNVVIGLVVFALMYAGLNFIIPGGVFSS